jgi:hypothetical protein
VARLSVSVQQDHRIALARDEIVQARAVDVGEAALYSLRRFISSQFFARCHDFSFSNGRRKYPTGSDWTQQASGAPFVPESEGRRGPLQNHSLIE